MSAQLELWDGRGTVLSANAAVALEVRESPRARRLILQVVPPRTVEVVVPKGTRAGTVESFIQAHRDWIHRAERELIEAYPVIELRPTTVELAALGHSVGVRYLEAVGGKARIRYGERDLQLYCAEPDFRDGPGLLRRWLLREAGRRLKPWLMQEAQRTGLMPRRVQVRLQKTRWGSCSSSGSISLNAALMLVQPELVRYLFVHELSHLKHLSHSRQYWSTVGRHEPDYRNLDRRLAESWRLMPAWLQFADRG